MKLDRETMIDAINGAVAYLTTTVIAAIGFAGFGFLALLTLTW